MVIDTVAMVWRRRVSNDAPGGYRYNINYSCIAVYRMKYKGRGIQKEDENFNRLI